MKRNEFLRISAFAAAAISLPLLHSCQGGVNGKAIGQPVFLSRLFDENTIMDVGKAYLQKMPSENDDNKLLGLLAGDGAIAKSSDEKAIHQFLEEKIKKDFEEGNTVLVRGWVLAVTEARQCALFSLVNI